MKIKLGIALLLAAMVSQVMADELRYVQARQAKLYVEPSLKSPVLAVLPKGESVALIETQGRWLKVSVEGKTGWLSRLVVADHPPMKRVSVLADTQADLGENARRRASATAAAAAARGLRGEERARPSDREVVNFSALEEMEAHSVPEDEALQFLEQPLAR